MGGMRVLASSAPGCPARPDATAAGSKKVWPRGVWRLKSFSDQIGQPQRFIKRGTFSLAATS